MTKEEQKARARAANHLNSMLSEAGITTDKFFEEMDIVNKYSLEEISCALTHYCFRNGSVEDMHAGPKSQLSDADMKVLKNIATTKYSHF
ncbi:MAG: hypothetical protein FWC00_01200 [Firmicutes bacterium]|nr:hypothetical protein [Bacillota bacterium]